MGVLLKLRRRRPQLGAECLSFGRSPCRQHIMCCCRFRTWGLKGMCTSDPRSDLDQFTTKACFCGVARYISFDIWQGCARQIHAAIWTNPQRRRTLVEQPYMHFLIFAIAFFWLLRFIHIHQAMWRICTFYIFPLDMGIQWYTMTPPLSRISCICWQRGRCCWR